MAGNTQRMPSDRVLFENLVGDEHSAGSAPPKHAPQPHTHTISALLHSSPLLTAEDTVHNNARAVCTEAHDGQRRRRAKREPMMALRPGSMATEMGSSLASAEQLRLSSMSTEQRGAVFARLRDDTAQFLMHAPDDWKPDEECRRYTVLGDCFTCVRWQGRFVVSGADVVRAVVALYRLATLGRMPSDRRRFEESVLSDMRSLKVGVSAFIEPANSPLLRLLYRLNAARTNKRQKVFLWRDVPFFALAQDALAREARYEGSRPALIGPYENYVRSAASPQGSALSVSPPGNLSPPQTGANAAWPSAHRVADMSTEDLMHMHAQSLMRLRAASIPCASGGTLPYTSMKHSNKPLPAKEVHSALCKQPKALESPRSVMSVLVLAAETALLTAEGNIAGTLHSPFAE